ncbi:hypothetical protein OCU04_002931 [Sclerotinia nivalis]|uniref:Uncharacterized protein n=1 Tax=Sclerotinia nivalis TaxID=352851 RepID=A0A9X0AUN2_9HELO|nr:hypothetical protein OCU04_002931 [Sclerotinia nivalis]
MLDLEFGNESFSVIEKVNITEKARKIKASEKERQGTKSTNTTRTKSTSRASLSTAERGLQVRVLHHLRQIMEKKTDLNSTELKRPASKGRIGSDPSIIEQGTS